MTKRKIADWLAVIIGAVVLVLVAWFVVTSTNADPTAITVPHDFFEFAETNVLPVVTDIKESSVVVTNVVEADNASGCSGYWINHQTGDAYLTVYHEFHADCAPYVPPTEKTQTTTVKRIETLTFMWHGRPWTATVETVLRETVRTWTLKEEWEEVAE